MWPCLFDFDLVDAIKTYLAVTFAELEGIVGMKDMVALKLGQ